MGLYQFIVKWKLERKHPDWKYSTLLYRSTHFKHLLEHETDDIPKWKSLFYIITKA